MSACEKCWADSRGGVEYHQLIKERAANPCTPEQQAGPYARQCPVCQRMTLHQHTREPMCGCKPSNPSERVMAELWCLHVLGPDDVHAAPSKLAAEQKAWELTRHYSGTDMAEVMSFKAEPWPWSAESHTADLKLWDEKFNAPKPAGGQS